MAEKKTNKEMLQEVNDKLDKLIANDKKGTKSSAAKKPAAKKPEPKKPAAKKEPVKQEAPAEEPVTQVVVEAPAAEPVAEEPAPAPVEPVAEEPVAEEPKAEEPAPAPTEEPKAEEPAPAEEPVEEPVAEEPKEEAAAAADTKPEKAKKGGFAGKTNDFLQNKGKLPIFIIINSLFLVSTILLMFAAFAYPAGTINIFQYFSRSAALKVFFARQAAGWGNGAYVMVGIFMFLAMLVPLALVVKNLIMLLVKKDKSVYKFDAIVYYATMLGFVTLVNLFGAYVSAGQLISLIISLVILAFTIFALLISKSGKAIPFFSIANIVLIFVALFLLTWKVYSAKVGKQSYAWAPAAAADVASGGAFLFIMLLITCLALVATVVMQLKRFPGKIGKLIELIVPIVAGVGALISLIVAGAGKPTGLTLSAGFAIGAIVTLLIAVADTLFTLIKPFQKFKVMVDDGESAAPAAKGEEKLFCMNCGEQNEPGTSYCLKCGEPLNK